MTYNDWLDFIKKIETSKLSDDMLDVIKNNQLNDSFKENVLTKMDEAIYKRLSTATENIASKLTYLFEDEYLMEMQLVIFKKETKILYKIVKSGIFSQEYVEKRTEQIRDDVDKIFDILYNEANKIDFSGVLGMSIKNNRIRWDKDEL